ncbi:MAG: hypothetical protein LBT05_09865 [Planctomycetaceae bacterium]|nr:hypothetical protein [Planctomycetaceae bacterium]
MINSVSTSLLGYAACVAMKFRISLYSCPGKLSGTPEKLSGESYKSDGGKRKFRAKRRKSRRIY